MWSRSFHAQVAWTNTHTCMDPNFLAHLVMAAVNKKAYCPAVAAIKDKYYELYRGKGGASSSSSQREDDDAEAEFADIEADSD